MSTYLTRIRSNTINGVKHFLCTHYNTGKDYINEATREIRKRQKVARREYELSLALARGEITEGQKHVLLTQFKKENNL